MNTFIDAWVLLMSTSLACLRCHDCLTTTRIIGCPFLSGYFSISVPWPFRPKSVLEHYSLRAFRCNASLKLSTVKTCLVSASNHPAKLFR